VFVLKTPCYANNFLISEVMDMAQLARGFLGFQCHRFGLVETHFFSVLQNIIPNNQIKIRRGTPFQQNLNVPRGDELSMGGGVKHNKTLP